MRKHSVSIIVPARDEAGTIKKLVEETPIMGKLTEIIFIEGHSKDKTWEEITRLCPFDSFDFAQYKSAQGFGGQGKLKIQAYKQRGWGKANAVEIGFEKARGDILMILDADLSVDPKELPKFYKAIASGKADFANGSRFIFPKESGAMRLVNHIGNIFFSFVFTHLLGQKVTDTLCGTKAFWKEDYKKILKVTKGFSRHDPYGDFTLFLGAGTLGLKIVEVPITYKARIYGKPKISRLKDGAKLLIVLAKALRYFAKAGE